MLDNRLSSIAISFGMRPKDRCWEAQQTIAELRARNQRLEEQRKVMMQRLSELQAQARLPQASAHQASAASDHNGADIGEALKALASSVGESMRELKEIVSPKARKKPVFTGVGLPSPSSPRKGSSKPQVFSTPKPPPGRRPAPPEMFDIGSEQDEGEEEENIEHDPVINPDAEDHEGSK